MDFFKLSITVLGGLSIFIYGMGLMSEGLTQIACSRLKAALWSDARLRGAHAKEALAVLSVFNCLRDIASHFGNIAVRAPAFA